jgi:hypothetical protein
MQRKSHGSFTLLWVLNHHYECGPVDRKSGETMPRDSIENEILRSISRDVTTKRNTTLDNQHSRVSGWGENENSRDEVDMTLASKFRLGYLRPALTPTDRIYWPSCLLYKCPPRGHCNFPYLGMWQTSEFSWKTSNQTQVLDLALKENWQLNYTVITSWTMIAKEKTSTLLS